VDLDIHRTKYPFSNQYGLAAKTTPETQPTT